MAESRKSEERQINESLTMEESETYSWWSGHKQRGHCQENHNNPPKKKWEPVAEVKRSPPMVLRCLVLAPFWISFFLAENCRMRSLNTDSQFWLIWGYPHLRKRPCATKTSDVFQLSLIVSTWPDSAAQKMGVTPKSSLISTSAPRFRKTFVAAILVKTSSTPQNLRSKFQDSTPNPWCSAFVARIYQFLDAQFEIERLWCYV